jgi:hypothetical protein
MIKRVVFNLSAVAGILLYGLSAHQAIAAETDKTKLAKAAQNPIASMISLPIQNNTNFDFGPQEKTQNVLNIQPVWPFSIGEDLNLITRVIMPVISQPAVFPEQDRVAGVGDISFTGFFSPSNSGSWTWGLGPTIQAPTASNDRLGTDRWALGASFVALTMPGQWVYGALLSNIWSVGGSSKPDINQLLIQPFINYNIPDSGGWYLSSVPIITANWEADGGDRWTVPIGGGAGRVFSVGKQAMNAQVQAFYNVEKPEFGADWQLRLQLQFLFPR